QDRVLTREQVARSIDRGCRALPLALLGELDAITGDLGDPAVRPDDRDDTIHARVARGVDDPSEHWTAADLVENLWPRAAHPGAVPGGHDERGRHGRSVARRCYLRLPLGGSSNRLRR